MRANGKPNILNKFIDVAHFVPKNKKSNKNILFF